MKLITWLFGENPISEQKFSADESQAHLDDKIEEVYRSTERMVRQAQVENTKSQYIIITAEKVLRSLRRFEERHQR